MKQFYCSVLGVFVALSAFGQHESSFRSAYQKNPFVPSGLLEAVAYSNTHIKNIKSSDLESCSGMPLPYGVMGVFENGKGYFRENGRLIENISGISIKKQKRDVNAQIIAYARTFNHFMREVTGGNVTLAHDPKYIRSVLAELSEIPMEGKVNLYAMDLQAFEILRNLNNPELAQRYSFQTKQIDFQQVFGSTNAALLMGEHVELTETGITDPTRPQLSFQPTQHQTANPLMNKSTEYGPAIWNAAPSCNFSSRSGTAISAITIHTIQGSYAGAISWSQNCNSNVSYHYVIRSSDGQVTQMVLEANKAWHVGNANPYTIGYEHEGYVSDASWYTTAMYNSSAALSRDICNSGYGINPKRTYHKASSSGVNVLGDCVKIKGHQHYANQTHTDPGINWDWERYYKLINPAGTPTSYTAATGNIYDSGGASGNYANDEHRFWLIQPTGASSVTLNFSSFNIESAYDYLLIYNGTTTSSPLIGKYTGTTIPSSVTASSGKMLIEFRSDCATVAAGWAASWTSNATTTPTPTSNLYTTIPADNSWKTADFSVNITDVATAGVQTRFYLLGMKPAGWAGWSARAPLGFVNEDFQDNRSNWTNGADTWTLTGGILKNTTATHANSNAYMSALQSQYSTYLYQWKQKITSTGSNQRAGLHFFCSNGAGTNRGNSYFVFFREATNKVQIYKVTNDVHTLVKEDACTVNVGVQYDVKVVYNPANGTIKVFVDDVLKSTWVDSSPLLTGNAISLRTGECITEFDNIRMYRSRSTSVSVNVGPVGHFNQKSVNSVRSGLLRSIILSSANTWSTEVYQQYLVDFSTALPTQLTYESKRENGALAIEGQFLFEDEESGIESIHMAIGSAPGQNDLMDWTNVTDETSFSERVYTRMDNEEAHVTFVVRNGAGMEEIYQLKKGGINADLVKVYPNPTRDAIHVANIPMDTKARILDQTGREVWSGIVQPSESISLGHLTNGIYYIHLVTDAMEITKSIIKD